ncbi:MAG: hypothetical protein KDA24_12100 [Deltaproteobacteria bacterium]|nr:hypothetical protein [Deltaproteobacteria bacterium]
MVRLLLLLAFLLPIASGCAPHRLTEEQMLDPQECASCHARAVDEWEGSMHAYASKDPVFRALVAKGQEETDGGLGAICVTCHAPLAVQMGATDDGLNLDEVDDALQGVTCAACHMADSVDGLNNNQITLAQDGVMRGAWGDPRATDAHDSARAPHLDRGHRASSDMCGACHDVVLPNGLHLEQTYKEWSESVFATQPETQLSCGQCHMRGRDGFGSDEPGARERTLHDHSMPGMDVALNDFPRREQQRQEVQDLLDISLLAFLGARVGPGGLIFDYTLENVGSGHGFPSGAAHNRRVWVEFEAWSGDQLIYSSGLAGEEEAVLDLDDPDLWMMRDIIYGADGEEVKHAWEAVTMDKVQLSPGLTADPVDPAFVHSVTRSYQVLGTPDRVRAQVRMRPFGLDVVGPLVDGGYLEQSAVDAMPTFLLASTVKEWTAE